MPLPRPLHIATVVVVLLVAASPLLAGRPLPQDADAVRTHRIATGPGEVMNVTERGTGVPVVVVPGLLGSAYSFRKVAAPLAASGFRVVVVEPLGIGDSARPEGADYSLEAQARRVGVALDSLRIDSAIVVAHAVGASIALRLALQRPGLVRGLVSIEGGIAEAAGTPELRNALSLARFIGLLGGEGIVIGKLKDRFAKASGDPAWASDAVLEVYLAPMREDFGATLQAYRAMADADESIPLAPRLDHVRFPVHLLRGGAEHEGGVPTAEVEAMRARIADFREEVVDGAGLWIQEERPAAVVAAVIRLALAAFPPRLAI